MKYDLLIRGASVVKTDGVEGLCIGIEDGRVAEMAPELTGEARDTVDARGLHLFPGVIDAHVHFNDPGRSEWEGVASGSAALAAGGGTCFIDMPLNSTPPTLDAPSFAAKLAACSAAARADFALWGGLTPDNLDSLEALADCGVVGYKAFMSGSGIENFRRCDDEDLYRGMRIAASRGLPVAVHAEDEALVGSSSPRRRARRAASRRGTSWIPAPWTPRPGPSPAPSRSRERRAAAPRRPHQLGPWGAADSRGRRRGNRRRQLRDLPHYLLFCDTDVEALGARAKCAPPLRPAAERDELAAQQYAERSRATCT